MVVPRIRASIVYIKSELEEKEREEVFRLKRVKEKKMSKLEKDKLEAVEEIKPADKPGKAVAKVEIVEPIKAEPKAAAEMGDLIVVMQSNDDDVDKGDVFLPPNGRIDENITEIELLDDIESEKDWKESLNEKYKGDKVPIGEHFETGEWFESADSKKTTEMSEINLKSEDSDDSNPALTPTSFLPSKVQSKMNLSQSELNELSRSTKKAFEATEETEETDMPTETDSLEFQIDDKGKVVGAVPKFQTPVLPRQLSQDITENEPTEQNTGGEESPQNNRSILKISEKATKQTRIDSPEKNEDVTKSKDLKRQSSRVSFKSKRAEIKSDNSATDSKPSKSDTNKGRKLSIIDEANEFETQETADIDKSPPSEEVDVEQLKRATSDDDLPVLTPTSIIPSKTESRMNLSQSELKIFDKKVDGVKKSTDSKTIEATESDSLEFEIDEKGKVKSVTTIKSTQRASSLTVSDKAQTSKKAKQLNAEEEDEEVFKKKSSKVEFKEDIASDTKQTDIATKESRINKQLSILDEDGISETEKRNITPDEDSKTDLKELKREFSDDDEPVLTPTNFLPSKKDSRMNLSRSELANLDKSQNVKKTKAVEDVESTDSDLEFKIDEQGKVTSISNVKSQEASRIKDGRKNSKEKKNSKDETNDNEPSTSKKRKEK